jgi:predicted DNA-binding transcriptional regulator AlpA
VQLHGAGANSPAELAELFGGGRSTVYRTLERSRALAAPAAVELAAGEAR